MAQLSSGLEEADTPEARWRQIGSLYLSDKYSDLAVVCGGETLPVHRSIVCTQSDYFRGCCDGNFQEESKPLDLTGHSLTLIKEMFRYFYSGEYTIPSSEEGEETNSKKTTDEKSSHVEEPNIDTQPDLDTVTSSATTSSKHPACFHARMYAKGVYFLSPGLQAKATKRFRASLVDDLNNEPFMDIIKEVYATESSARGLRDTVIQLMMGNLPEFCDPKRLILKRNILESVPEFAVDLCIASVNRNVASGNKPWSGFGSVNPAKDEW